MTRLHPMRDSASARTAAPPMHCRSTPRTAHSSRISCNAIRREGPGIDQTRTSALRIASNRPRDLSARAPSIARRVSRLPPLPTHRVATPGAARGRIPLKFSRYLSASSSIADYSQEAENYQGRQARQVSHGHVADRARNAHRRYATES